MNPQVVARAGVKAVELAALEGLGWYPREPSAPDYGIDLYIECANDRIPTGRMLAVQIKSGPSYFGERTSDGVVYRGDAGHLR